MDEDEVGRGRDPELPECAAAMEVTPTPGTRAVISTPREEEDERRG